MKLIVLKKRVVLPYAYDPRVHGVTQSLLSTWMLCSEKARLGTVEGLTPRGSSKPLIHGDIMHRGLFYYYDHLLRRRPESAMRLSEWARTGFKEWWSSNPTAPSDSRDIAQESGSLSTILLPRYIQRWHAHDSKVRWTMAETKFEVPIDVAMDRGRHERVILTGKIDGAFEDGGEEHLFETKNKGEFSDKSMQSLTIDLQVGTYLTALGRLRKRQPRKVLYNLIRRPQERKKQGESLQEFGDRIAKNIDADPAHYFERYRVELSQAEVEKQVLSTEFKVAAFYRWWEAHDRGKLDPMWNGSACSQGWMTCHFVPVCAGADRSNHFVRSHPHPELQ